MAQPVDLKRLLATGRHLSESGRSQARQLGTDLAEQGRLATEQITAVVDALVSRGSRERVEELRQTVGAEVQHQLRTLGSEVKELLASQGELVAEGMAAALEELGMQRREFDAQLRVLDQRLRETVRDEVQRRLNTLGVATSEDLADLGRVIREDLTTFEDRLERLAGPPGHTSESEDDGQHPV